MDVKDSFLDLERQRLRLEENLGKLRQTLQHWQTWEAEYEGLKEEILAAGRNASSTVLVRLSLPPHPKNGSLSDTLTQIAIGRDFGGTLVDEKGTTLH